MGEKKIENRKDIVKSIAQKLIAGADRSVFCIVGPSGSGKTTVTDIIQNAVDNAMCDMGDTTTRGLVSVESMTTRPQRYPNERGHIFVTKEEFDRHEMIAYTRFNDYEYGVTADILDACDLYVVDIAGVKMMRQLYFNKPLVVIYLDITQEEAARRMAARGDTQEQIQSRLANDAVMFADLNGLAADDILDANRSADEVVDDICRIIDDTL